MALTAQQVADLKAAFNSSFAAKDATAYYTELSKYFFYGRLALGVVKDDTISGITANNYAENKISAELGGSFASGRADLMMNLMRRDFDARNAVNWNDINGRTISTYHDAAFSQTFESIARAPEGWTPYYAVRALNDYESWLPTSAAKSLIVSDQLYGRVKETLFDGSSSASSLAYKWLQDMDLWVFDPNNFRFAVGDNIIGKSLVEFVGKVPQSWSQFVQGEQPGGQSATDIAGFYGMSYRELQLSLVERSLAPGQNAFSGVVTLSNGGHLVDVAAAEGRGIVTDAWLSDAVVGVKLSVLGGLTAANVALVTTPGKSFAETFAKVEAFEPTKILYATASSATAATDGVVLAFQGHSSLRDSSGDDLIVGNAGADKIESKQGDDLVFGGAGADYITSVTGKTTIDGGAGNDFIKAPWFIDDFDAEDRFTIIVRTGSGRDVVEIEYKSFHVPGRVGAIRFEGLNKNDVSLVWNYTAENGARYGDAAIKFGESSIYVGEISGRETTITSMAETASSI